MLEVNCDQTEEPDLFWAGLRPTWLQNLKLTAAHVNTYFNQLYFDVTSLLWQEYDIPERSAQDWTDNFIIVYIVI